MAALIFDFLYKHPFRKLQFEVIIHKAFQRALILRKLSVVEDDSDYAVYLNLNDYLAIRGITDFLIDTDKFKFLAKLTATALKSD